MDLLSCALLLLLTCLTVHSLRSLLLSRRSKPSHKLPPGPSPLPIIGNLLELGKKPHQSSAKLAEIHGPIMTLKLGQLTTIVISSADMAKEVLQTHDQLLSNRTIPEAVAVHNHDHHSMTFMPMSPLWRGLRKICNNQLFANKTLDASQALRRKKVQELLSDIRQSSLIGEAVDIGRAAFKTTINLLSNTIFSVDLVDSSGRAGHFKELVANIMKEGGKPNLADYFPALKMFDLQGIKSRNTIYAGKVLEVFHELINQRMKLRLGTSYQSNNDMLEALLNISQENNSPEMGKINIEHLMLTLFVAGTDTITSTVEWAMAELLRNPKIMSKAKKELDQVIGKGNPIEESDIARLPYLQAIVNETFRLHPSVPFLIPRKADFDVQICGYTIPRGSQLLINAWAIGRDSSIWNNPNLFSPERFLGSEIDVKSRHFELIPFGGGRRICPGLPLAMRTLFLMLGSLINSFDWKLEKGMKPEDVDMGEEFGMALEKAKPLLAIPIKVNS